MEAHLKLLLYVAGLRGSFTLGEWVKPATQTCFYFCEPDDPGHVDGTCQNPECRH